jgi:hypothetical protein
MRIVLLVLVGLILIQNIKSQDKQKSIVIAEDFSGYKFIKDEQFLTYKQLYEIMKDDPELETIMNNAWSYKTLSTITGFVGGCMVGWTIGTKISGGKPDYLVGGIGCGLLLFSIPIGSHGSIQARKAVDIYNKKYCSSLIDSKTEIKLAFNPNGISIKFTF